MATKRLLLFITLFIILVSAKAQPGALDLSFDPGTGADSTILYTAVQPDGKILIGGGFSTFNGQARPFLARLNDDGSLDNTFNIGTGPNLKIFSITIQPDSKILVGGSISSFNGDSVCKLVRLMPDGSTDSTFRADTIFSLMKEIIVQPDGKILIGGSFISVNGKPYINLARLHSNGKLDTTFNTQNALNGTVETMALQPDGKLLIGGSFTQYAGVQGYRIARVNTNGSVDSTFNPGIGGAGSNVEAISLLPNGKILLGGEFTFYNGSTVGHIVRTKSDGTIDFTYPPNPGTNLPVRAIASLPDGSHIFGGDFTTYKGNAISSLALVNEDGTLNSMFNPGVGANGEITSLNIDPTNKLLVSGYFTSFDGKPYKRIVRLYNCLTTKPGTITGDSIVNCPNTTLTFSIAPVQDAAKYEWKLPAGWVGSSDSTSITVVSNGSPGTVSVRAFSQACGFSYPQTKVLNNSFIPAPAICLLTVDSASTHNIIIWEKQPTNLIDSFNIYREATNNVYTKIASVPYDSLSEYHDYNANPNTTSYRYKLSTVDTCGVESALSVFHNTIHLQYLGMGNFQWTFYQIQPGINPVISFNVYRDNFNNGNFSQIGFVSGSNATFTDVSYSSFPDANYVVDVNWGISCTPSRAVNTTRSNKRPLKENLWLSVADVSNPGISISPNPVKGRFTVKHGDDFVITKATLCNAIGQKVFTENHPSPKPEFNVEGLPAGVYFLRLESPAGISQHRLLLE